MTNWLERLEDRTYNAIDWFDWTFGFPLAAAISAASVVISAAAIILAVVRA